ncbi:MAG: efflux transporter outer membrane subunit [Robiginitomaculum sp.]
MTRPMVKLLASAALSAFMLGGCATFDGLREQARERLHIEPAPVAAQIALAAPAPAPKWAEPAPERLAITDWVSQIGGAELTALIDEALAANTNIGSSKARLDAARAAAISARSGKLPNVSLGGRASHSEFGNDRIGDSNSHSIGPSVSWEPDVWGRINDRAKAGEIEVAASTADYAAARLSIAGQTAQSWLDLIEARLLLALSQKNLQTQERALALTQRRFEGGVTSASDVRLSRSSVASAQASLASREQFRAISARRLEILLRRYPDATIGAATDLPPLRALSGAGAPRDILARRPDLLAAEQRLAAQGLQIDIARKALLPRLSLSADGNLSSGDFLGLFKIDALVANLASNLTAPIFNGGALKADVARNEAVLRGQVESYAGAVMGAYMDVENALDAERRLKQREAALRVSLTEAQKAEEILARRYAQGLASILQLLDAQSRAINSESALIGARKERLASRVRLHLALGGGDLGDVSLAQNTQFPSDYSQ